MIESAPLGLTVRRRPLRTDWLRDFLLQPPGGAVDLTLLACTRAQRGAVGLGGAFKSQGLASGAIDFLCDMVFYPTLSTGGLTLGVYVERRSRGSVEAWEEFSIGRFLVVEGTSFRAIPAPFLAHLRVVAPMLT